MTKEIYRTIGIYRITNLVTGKSYIGQTRMDFGDRRDSHFSLLNTGKHYNKNMQADWDIYMELKILNLLLLSLLIIQVS